MNVVPYNTALLLLLSSYSIIRNTSAFTINSSINGGILLSTQLFANNIGLYYSTIGGDTQDCACFIADEIGDGVEAIDIGDADIDDLKSKDCLIVGAPTWNTGAERERSMTIWDQWLYTELPKLDLTGKRLAVFGAGDQVGYKYNYCDAVGEIYECFMERGAEGNYGKTSTDGYNYVESKAVDEDGKFLGVVFDQDNQSELSRDRAKAWVRQLKKEGFM
eukprot:CAMPEP_0194175214 /NCGR_PEP_ID=MMETSP0154-20130528/9290_1 /TAXON_ID=1049557 /ORGANISM="Thalassiothrix antarctica, Strain L6-D1" /LENGTH=218 /DNA_ID=CAMNT_0038888939 /DNA_START=102 /DNA_END=758 /DNA_ORIENTATION=-